MCSSACRAVIFDLDGTLVHTRQASWQAFRPVSERYGLAVRDAAQFYELFQNNFFQSLRTLCADERQAAEVEKAFLDALRRDYAPPMIPGMVDVVKALAPHCTLAVLSSNVTPVIRRILLDSDVAYCFAHVFGGDVEPDKRRGIARFLADAARGAGRRCQAAYDEPEGGGDWCCTSVDAVLVTDTVGDVTAAVAAGIPAVGVAWGMHSEEDLLAAGADCVAIWPQELLAHLVDLTGEGGAGSCGTGQCAAGNCATGSCGTGSCGTGNGGAGTPAGVSRKGAESDDELARLRRSTAVRRARRQHAVAPPMTVTRDDNVVQNGHGGNGHAQYGQAPSGRASNGHAPQSDAQLLDAMRRIL